MRRAHAHATKALVLTILGVALAPRDARACAAAYAEGEHVCIAEEVALIAYDPATHVEHFVRRASFISSTAHFAFLVPTPTRPRLEAIDDKVFSRLAAKLTPPVELVHKSVEVHFRSIVHDLLEGEPDQVVTAGVDVVATKRVAGLDTAVLEARDPVALSKWLGDHGYEKRPGLVEWLRPYVERGWTITAFKFADPEATSGRRAPHSLGSEALWMAFTTDEPFYPYREPAALADLPALDKDCPKERSLRVYYFGSGRAQATLGAEVAWSAEVPLSAPADDALVKLLGLEDLLPTARWLTVFDDYSYPRAGTDEVYFHPSKDPSPVEIPPVVLEVANVELFLPVEAAAPVALAAFGLYRGLRRRKGRGSPAR